MNDYLKDVRKELNCSEAVFCTTSRRFRYEIELPEKVKVDAMDFTQTNKVKGKKRYVSDELSEFVEKLEQAEADLKNSLVPFLKSMFSRFYEFRQVF